MMRAVPTLVSLVAAAATVAACATNPDVAVPAHAGQAPDEGPPLPRLAAAPDSLAAPAPGPEAPPPHLALASFAKVPGSPADAPAVAPTSCPADMVLVDGEYCTEVRQKCLEWMEPPTNPLARCAKYGPTECVGERVHKRVCVDRDEYVAPGDPLPLSDVSWTQAQNICQKQGKRLCKETEWEFACEGEQMLPYPTGYERDAKICNFDKNPLLDRKGNLLDLRATEDEGKACVSPFGVRNMSGNVDEWVYRDRTNGEWRSALKGGWWMPARDRCRPATTAHDENFHGLQTGVRCCADADRN
jgi:hypothetical protein